MPRVAVHHHPCADCRAKTECPGTWEQTDDSKVFCPEFNMKDGGINTDFVCEDCQMKRDDQAQIDAGNPMEIG